MEVPLRLISTLIGIALISRLFVISASNPIHSVFALIRLFIRSTRLLFTLQADYLGILLLVVYVGAIAVLFLFVIMMLHLNLIAIQTTNILRYFPIGSIFGFLFLLNMMEYSNYIRNRPLIQRGLRGRGDKQINYVELEIHSINIFGEVLYSKYGIYFLIRSMILFVAMIGSIVITHDSNKKSLILNK
jgi:NADH-quinone oxidoreductase subunit J